MLVGWINIPRFNHVEPKRLNYRAIRTYRISNLFGSASGPLQPKIAGRSRWSMGHCSPDFSVKARVPWTTAFKGLCVPLNSPLDFCDGKSFDLHGNTLPTKHFVVMLKDVRERFT